MNIPIAIKMPGPIVTVPITIGANCSDISPPFDSFFACDNADLTFVNVSFNLPLFAGSFAQDHIFFNIAYFSL